MTGRIWIYICWLVLGVVVFDITIVSGQSTTTNEKPPLEQPVSPESLDVKDTVTMTTLRNILHSTEAIQDQLKTKEAELNGAETEEQKAMIAAEISELNRRLSTLKVDFESIMTGVDLEKFSARPAKRFDWQEEIQDVLGPIIEELKSITARPRELERLRNEVVYYEKRLPIVKKALENIRTLYTEAPPDTLKTAMEKVETRWIEKEQEISNELAVAQYQLNEKLKEEKPFVESARNILRLFFRSRGKNLLFALLAFLGVFLVLRYVYRLIYRMSPLLRSGNRPFYLRLADITYHLLTFVFATSAFLFILYLSGDWVLLGLALIFLFGLAWTAKQGIPLVWEQIKLFLNLSTVRENERVLYNGLPWKIISLNLYTKLHNPALKGGLIRLPLRELIGLHSRPFHKDEPWFPCQEGEFVVLADGTYGEVLMQTPETVQLLVFLSRKTYLTTEFLQLSPTNLSSNFTLQVTFGLDYQHQTNITQTVPEILKTTVSEMLKKQGDTDDLLSLNVEFKEAGASSLDLVILAEFSGRVANQYYVLSRALQKIAVDTCNQHGWVIPFTQITLHSGDTPKLPDHPRDKGNA